MDDNRFDAVTRSIASISSRREAARILARIALAAPAGILLGSPGVIAKKKRKKKKKTCGPCQLTKKGKCKGPKPDGTPCDGGSCLSGVCTPPAVSPPPPTPPPPPPVTRVDAECPGPSPGSSSAANGDWRLAQTIIPLSSGQLVTAQLVVIKNVGTIGDYILNIGTVDGAGVPTNTVIASTVLPNDNAFPGTGTYTFNFDVPAAVIAGTPYALILTRPGSSQLAVRGPDATTCAGAAFFSRSQTAVFEPIIATDLTYTIFVRS